MYQTSIITQCTVVRLTPASSVKVEALTCFPAFYLIRLCPVGSHTGRSCQKPALWEIWLDSFSRPLVPVSSLRVIRILQSISSSHARPELLFHTVFTRQMWPVLCVSVSSSINPIDIKLPASKFQSMTFDILYCKFISLLLIIVLDVTKACLLSQP